MSTSAGTVNGPAPEEIAATMAEFARLAIRASATIAGEGQRATQLLLQRLTGLCRAQRGALLLAGAQDGNETGQAEALARVRVLALQHMEEREIPPLVLSDPPATLMTQSRDDGIDWVINALPLHNMQPGESASVEQKQWVIILVGRNHNEQIPGMTDTITSICQTTGDAVLAIVQALLTAERVHRLEAGLRDAETTMSDMHTAIADWEQVFDAVSDPVSVISDDYHVVRANAAFRAHLGRGDDDILGHRCYSAETGTDAPCEGCPLPQTIQSSKPSFVQQEFIVRSPVTGEPVRRVYQRWTYPIIGDDGRVDRVVEILKDVTAQERLREVAMRTEALRHADHLKAELLGTVSHELRSPLASIKGYAATLLRYERRLPREERHEFLLAIEEASARLEVIISRLLEISQLETGGLPVQREPLDIGHTIREAITVAENSASVKAPEKFTFVARQLTEDGTSASQLPLIQADPRMIREVLDNLLENAIKYSPEGGTIEISARPITLADVDDLPLPGGAREFRAGEHMLEITVHDMGTGIPSEHLGYIFDRFHRVDTRLTREVDGLGLGLAICKRIVELHDGAIWAESSPGAGSTFHVVLPLQDSLVSMR